MPWLLRNCAEAGIRDVGIIGLDSGWEMYVAGNGGIKTEVAHFFVKLMMAQEVLDGEPDPWFEFDKASVDTRQFGKLAVPV